MHYIKDLPWLILYDFYALLRKKSCCFALEKSHVVLWVALPVNHMMSAQCLSTPLLKSCLKSK